MNKTLLLIARITSLITGIIYCLTFIGLPIGILNLVASSKFQKAKDGDSNITRENVRNWSIYLLFTDLLSGILGLIASTAEEVVHDFTSTAERSKSSTNIEERLKNLRTLYESGMISRDEYDRRRQEILNEI